METFTDILHTLDDSLWSYIALPGIMLLSFYFSFKSKFVQIRKFPHIIRTFLKLLRTKNETTSGAIHPLKAFFACIGGCIGIGNVVAICTAVQIGGPGALFWIWITAIAGSILKYSEIYLGLSYRVKNEKGGYNGGPMYFLQKVFKKPFVPCLAAFLLCIYGVEIYQFGVVAETLHQNFNVDKIYIVVGLTTLVLAAALGGIRLVGEICSMLVPFFIVCYLAMGTYILSIHFNEIPGLIKLVFSSAFTGHAALGAFAGSSMLIAVSQGLRRGCYSGDIGIGYASIIHSESQEASPEKQASLAIFDIFVDTFMICTTSILIILVTGIWQEPIDASILIQTALQQYFPYMEFFMPLFLFLLGYTTVIAYFCTGVKCAEFLSPKYGRVIYYLLGASFFICFSFAETTYALMAMSITGASLLCINLYGIYHLRHEVSFSLEETNKELDLIAKDHV
ncbi:MAG TPA: amino acid carrier protein [Parachlamydiaceae bacterium]|nr:amino acid carrier protein [Parachlamydiaceae bacterium]